MFLIVFAAILSIVHANGWFIVPLFVRVLCWVLSIFFGLVCAFVKGVAAGVSGQ